MKKVEKILQNIKYTHKYNSILFSSFQAKISFISRFLNRIQAPPLKKWIRIRNQIQIQDQGQKHFSTKYKIVKLVSYFSPIFMLNHQDIRKVLLI